MGMVNCLRNKPVGWNLRTGIAEREGDKKVTKTLTGPVISTVSEKAGPLLGSNIAPRGCNRVP